MNKIFKVVWSKTKECYIVVSEVAKNNSGKKKVLASVLAALAVVGAGATQVDAASFGAGGGNAAADASISIGGGYSGPKTAANDKFAIAIGDNASATGKSSISMGYKSATNGQVSIAIGEESKVNDSEGTAVGAGAIVEKRFGAAFGHEAKATKQYATAIGSGAQGEGEDSQAIGRQAQTTGYRAVAVGTLAKALNNSAVAIGEKSVADGTNSIAMGKSSKAHSFDAIAIGHNNNSRTYSAISIGTDNTSDVAYGLTDAQFDALKYDENNINDPSKTDPRRGVSSTIAIGRNNVAGNVEAIAIGTETKATKTDAIAIGARAEATGDYALAIGGAAGGYKVTADEYGTAVGVRSNAANRGAAFGAGSNAGSQKSVAIGYTAKASAQKATSNYEFSGSHGTPSPAGYDTETITVNAGSVPTSGAAAGNYYDAGSAVAIGDGATVSDESDRAVVVGAGAKTNGNAHYSVVLGSGSHADASDGFVAGHGSFVESRESIAMGSAAHVSGNENIRSQAIGYGATVSGTGAYDATAIGATAQVSGVQGGVALGAGSLLSRTTNSNENAGFNSKFVDGTKVRNRAYTADLTGHGDQWDSGRINTGAVSVGNDTQKRQIINVAAGSQDTDAVNVAQLKNVGVRVGADTNTATIGTNKVAADFLAYNGQLNIKGDNNRVTTVSENDANGKDANVNVKFDYDGLVKAKTGSAVTVDQKTDGNGKTYFEIDAAAASKTVLADGKNTTVTGAGTTASPYKVNVEGALTGISSITNNSGGKIEFTTSGTTISGGPVNVSNNKITGVADGDVSSTSKDAVNGSQLHAVKTAERHIAPTTAGHEYTVDSNGDVTMTYLDGNNNAVANEKAVIKGIAKQDLSNINDAGKKVITGLGTIVKAGDNVNVSESSDATTGQKTYTVNAVTPAVYTKADGTKVYKRPDGTFTTNQNLAAGNNVDKGDVITSFMDGNGNTTGGNMVINNVGSAIDKTGTSTGSRFLTKLDTAATNTPNAAVNVKDLKTTSDALVDKGLRFDANEGNEKTNKLGSKVTVQGTGALTAGKAYADEYNTANIRTNINQDSDGNTTINVGLAKALKGINSISNGNSSITLNSNPGGTGNTPAVSITGGNVDVGGNNITNLKSGGDVDSNAANIGDVKKIASDTDTHIKPGTYTVAADKTVTMTYVNGKGETVQANGQDVVAKIDLSGLPTGGTSSTEKVQKAADANGDKNIADVNPKAGDTFGAADATYEVSVSRNAVKDAAREAVTVNNGGTTKADGSYTADTNNPISVTPTKDDNNHNTSYAVTFDGNKAAKQIPLTYKATNGTTTSAAQTVTLDKGLNFTGGDYTTASVGADGKVTFDVNLGTTPTVTDGKPGVPGQAGATGKDGIATVKTVVDTINNSGWKANAKANGGKLDGTATATVVKPGNTVNYAAGKNLIVNQELEKDASNALTGNQTYTYSLNKDIDLTNAGSLTVGDTTVNNGGITIKAPTPAAGATATTDVKLTNTGLDNGGNKIVNVKDGDVSATSTDAVNGSQLHAVKAAERHIKPDTYAVDGNGKVTMKYVDGDNQDVTGEAVITGIAKQDLSNINDAGKNVITGLGTIVKAGDNVSVSESSDATTGQKTYTVNAVTPAVYTTPDGEKLTKKSDGKFYKADGSEYTGGDIITSFENPNANSIPAGKNSTTDGGMIVNNIGSAIKNQTPTMPAGQTATYLDKLKAAADAGSNVKNAAVNVSDLHNTAEALKSNELHIRPTVTNRTDETVNKNTAGTAESYKYDATTKSVILKYNDGTGAGVTGTEAKIDLSDLANQITSGYTFKTNATENGGKVVNDAATPAAETAVANGGVVNYAAGKNLTVKQDIEKDGTGAATGKQTYTYALADEIGIGEKGQPGVAGKDGVDGKIGVNGKDGSSVVINGKDGSIGMTGPKGQDGKDGINGRDGANISMTSAKGEQVLINRDPAHSADTDKAERIVYVPKDASGNPIQDANGKNIVREVATMDDGLKFGGDMGTVNSVKLNKQVDVKGGITDTNKLATGNNIGVTSGIDPTTNNATLNVQLAKDLTGLNSVELGGKTIKTDGDHITITSPDTTPGATPGATTTTKVANLDDEKHIKAGSYAVQNDGSVTLNYQDGNNNDLTETAKITGIAKQDLSNINNAGKTVITGLGTIVKAGDNVTVSEAADATTGQKTYTVNAVTPAIYTDKNGNKVVKRPDGTYTTNLDGSTGNDVAANDVIVSFKDAAGNTTGGNSIINNVGSAIKNQTPTMPTGVTATYLDKLKAAADDTKTQNAAVNVSDLHNTANALKDSELHIAPTAVKSGSTEAKGGAASGNTNPGAAAQAYKYNATTKQVELTFNDGNGNAVANTKAVIDLSNLPTGGDMSSFHVTSSAESTTVGTHAGDTTQEIKDGKSIDFQAGKNMTVTQTNNSGNTVINYALDKNLDVESVHVGKDGKDGKIGIDGKDGVDGLNGTNRVDIHVEKGAKGVDGTDGHDGVNGHNGKDGMTRIVYEDKGGKQEVATLNDGLKFTGNNESTVNNHKLNTLVKVQGEGTKEGTNAAGAKEIQTSDGTKFESAKDNIAVVADGTDTLTVKLNKNLKGLDSVQTKTVVLGNPDAVNGTTNITYNPTDKRIEYVTPDAAGTGTTTNKVANLDDEKHIKAGSYAVQNDGSVTLNYQDGNNNDLTETAKITGIAKQDLSNIDNAGKTVITGLGTIVKAGDNVSVSEAADATTGQKTYTVNAVTPAIYTDKNGNKVVKRPDGTYTTNLDGSTGNDVAANDVIVSFKDAAGNTTGGNSIINNVGSAIKNQTPTMPAGQTATYLDKLKAAADDTKTQNAAVNVSDLHNTANALRDNELHIAPTAVKSGSTEAKGGAASGNTNPGAAAQAYKYNATTKQVELTFNDGNGNAVANTKAVIDLSELAGSIQNYGFQTNADGNLKDGTTATATAVASGKTVTYAAGKNLTVEQEIAANGNQTYTYALNKDLTNLDKVVVNGKDGIDGKDGVSITGPKGESAPGAKDGQDGKVGIAGKDGKDAVSISGKDGVGHIGLQGPKGTPGTPGADGASLDISTDHGTQTLVKPEANNDNKSERIVYVPKDKDGNPLKDTDGNPIKREVATMDDGLKFAGDDGQTNANKVIAKQLNQRVDIIGGADSTKLTDNNIGVNNDGHGKLKVQLAKNIDLTKDGSVTTGNTKVNNDGITITKPATATDPAKTVSLTGDGLNNGGNKITNVKAGEDPTDAVNVQQLNDKVTTVKSSDNTISVKDTNLDNAGNVIDKTKGHQYDITINNQGVVNKAQTPVVYTKEDGTKVYLVNGKFYDNPEGNGAEVPKAQVIASMNNADNSSITPMKLNNVGSSIANETGTTFLDKLNSANTNTPNGAVNVSDLKSTADDLINKGLKFDANSGGVKTNKLGSTVKVQGEGTKADNEYSGENIKTIIGQDNDGNTTIDVKLDKNLKSETITVTGQNGKDGKIGLNGKDGTNGLDGTTRVDIQVEKGVDGIDGKNGTDGISRIVYEDKAGKHTVATMEDGLAFKGDNATVVKKKLGQQLDIIGGADSTKLTDNNIGVNADNDGKLKVQLAKDVNLTKDGSLTIGDTKVNNDGITITKPAAGTDPAKTVTLTGDGLNNGGNKITNVKAGEAPTDAVNVQQLNDKVTTVESSDNTISVKDTNLDNAGHVIDKTKGHQYDITINSQGVVNKAQTPVVYTKDDGTKVYLVNDKFYDNPEGNGAEVPKAQVIASMNNADGSTTTPMKLNNVGSSIQNPNSTDTFLKQLEDADKNTPNGAVNVSDLKKTSDALIDKGLVFDANNADPKTNKLGSKVTIAGTGALANGENFADKYNTDNIRTNIKQDAAGNTTVEIGLNKNLKGLESVSIPGKDGVDGQDGVSITGKDGANGIDGKVGIGKDGKDAVSISGKDGIGHIGLTGAAGKDGKDATADITVKEGKAGVDGKDGVDGITRIVYNDKDGNEHQVATHDDGLKFTGNNESTVNKHHLNSLVKVQGEGVTEAQSTSFQSAAGNINVKANGTDTLEIQLNKDLKGINSIRNSTNGPAMTFNTGDIAISGGNLSMGDGTHNNKIVNLAAGTNDTDAVNYKQLKDSRTTVTSQDGSVTITPTPNGDSMNYDLKVNPPLDPRVDQLAEEVGRVGAQGAALSALKPIQYDPLEPTQIMAGYGNYRGNSAIAMGVAHYKNESTLIHGGISWAGGSSHMMANAGVTWKVGNRDSEAAVADRYRKGPISSAYAMQQEMAAMKAQNAGLKGEVSDLKAENEQMKAQIAAMMAKLGL